MSLPPLGNELTVMILLAGDRGRGVNIVPPLRRLRLPWRAARALSPPCLNPTGRKLMTKLCYNSIPKKLVHLNYRVDGYGLFGRKTLAAPFQQSPHQNT